MFSENFYEAFRNFQYDYIFFDAIFLCVWLFTLIYFKKWSALAAGLGFGIIIYFIDSVWWWNSSAGPNYPPGTMIREYWIGGVQMPHPLGDDFLLKFGADFMMTISYAMFTFGWLWIVFENYTKKNPKEILLFSFLYLGSWLATPFLSFLIPWDDTPVYTVRHMDTQFLVWIVNVIVGYVILTIIYGTNILKKKNPKIIPYVLATGIAASFCMEFPLLIFGIRPSGIFFLLFELGFLFNQGAPYLYIMYDILFPFLGKKLRRSEKVAKIREITM